MVNDFSLGFFVSFSPSCLRSIWGSACWSIVIMIAMLIVLIVISILMGTTMLLHTAEVADVLLWAGSKLIRSVGIRTHRYWRSQYQV